MFTLAIRGQKGIFREKIPMPSLRAVASAGITYILKSSGKITLMFTLAPML